MNDNETLAYELSADLEKTQTELDAAEKRIRELERRMSEAAAKLWATQECHPNAIGTLAWEAYEILQSDARAVTAPRTAP